MHSYRESKNGITIYHKYVNINAIEYWKDQGFHRINDYKTTGICHIQKIWSYRIVRTFRDLYDTIEQNGKYGIANRNGQIILPCIYESVIVGIEEGNNGICMVKFVTFSDTNICIYSFDGCKVTLQPKIDIDGTFLFHSPNPNAEIA